MKGEAERKGRPPEVMIIAGEASGDLHGAKLLHALKVIAPGLSACGMGGRELRGEGMEVLVDASRLAVVGLLEVIGHWSHIRAAMSILSARLRQRPPDLLILIDYPDFNLLLAAKAKKMGVPVFYYISPQVWAWRSSRVEKIARLIDRMAVILPFEADFYRRRGVCVEFVGHPLLDSVASTTPREQLLASQGLPPEITAVAILPGSRKKELTRMLPLFLAAAVQLAKQSPKRLAFFLPLASTLNKDDLAPFEIDGLGLDLLVITDSNYAAMAACDVAIAASGTVTLELAILGVPMVVAYRVAPLTYWLARRLVKVPHFSLVNLVAGQTVVPELLQDDATPERLAQATTQLLEDGEAARRMREQLAAVTSKLGSPGASGRAARLALELIGKGSL